MIEKSDLHELLNVEKCEDSFLNEEELNDKVFIHPETINSSLGSLNKRVDFRNSQTNETSKRDHKSRSMSLPVYSDIDLFSSDQESSQGFQQVSSSSNNSLLSPMRKFDFTFCE
jgi:hypothetical protein